MKAMPRFLPLIVPEMSIQRAFQSPGLSATSRDLGSKVSPSATVTISGLGKLGAISHSSSAIA